MIKKEFEGVSDIKELQIPVLGPTGANIVFSGVIGGVAVWVR